MKRIIVLSSLVTSAVWLALTTVAVLIALPAVVEAQVNQITTGSLIVGGAAASGMADCSSITPGCAGSITLVSSSGSPLVELEPAQGSNGVTLPQPTGGVQVYGADGKARVRLATGVARTDDGNLDPASAGVTVQYADGSTGMARLGTMDFAHPAGVAAGSPAVYLKDTANNVRFLAYLDGSGNASIRIYDASGNVTWSAP
jgi:hypothetical protein